MRCSWYLVYINCLQITDGRRPPAKKGDTMSKTASIALTPSSTLFSRLLSTIDRLLMKSAEIANRNGDLPRVGL